MGPLEGEAAPSGRCEAKARPSVPRWAPHARRCGGVARRLLATRADRHPHRGLLAILFRSGLRISEALALFAKDIDPAGG